ncbi:MurR/RpiR family transcriptional regulator [Streptomyces sp. TS71-3]|uniref:MurR/RpiR family transcriptional regulator n=1 Tax=Streptomyces sp. TS71-3 TaxID=2733862 RepID=UPI001B096372|nr:MurR/RpiR family transcriptional regulator [Streptomyces sp. TS71-3]GHJ39261.1 hypothetical protein Sm713_48700 [Streptomyces sp. TS71-3]
MPTEHSSDTEAGSPEPDEDSLDARIEARLATMTRAERKVAEYLRTHRQEVIFATAEQIGAGSNTSDATVVRTAKTLGYSGLLELKYSLGMQVIQATRPSERLHQRIERAGQDSATALDMVFTEAVERLTETRRLMLPADLAKAVDLVAGAREVLAVAFGVSEIMADYLALRLNRAGRRARAATHTGFRLADDLIALGQDDLVVLYAPGRHFDEIDPLLEHASAVGARTLLISDSLIPVLGDRVTASLYAVHSPGGFTSETLCAHVLTDALLLGVASRDEERATATSELLTRLRTALPGTGMTAAGSRGAFKRPPEEPR